MRTAAARDMLKDRISNVSPWTLVTLAGCATLVLVDQWRQQMPALLSYAHGTLPNLVAVPTLTFGFLMLRFPERRRYTDVEATQQRRLFRGFWAAAIVVTVVWELAQLHGNLVFDPLDLAATAIGAALAIVLFRNLRHLSYRPAAEPRSGIE